MTTPVAFERIDENVLGRFRGNVSPILPAAPGADAEAKPVAGPQAHTLMAERIDKGLQQPRAMTITGLEVPRQAAQCPAEDMTGQVEAVNPGSDQESRQVNDIVQMLATRLVVPADSLIPGLQPPGRRSKTHRREPARFSTDQILQLRSEERPRAPRMFMMQQLRPDPSRGGIVHADQLELAEGGQIRRVNVQRRGNLRHTAGPALSRCRQPNVAGGIEFMQRCQAAGTLWSSLRITKAELDAERIRQLSAVGKAAIIDSRTDARETFRCRKRALDLRLRVHVTNDSGRRFSCSALVMSIGQS